MISPCKSPNKTQKIPPYRNDMAFFCISLLQKLAGREAVVFLEHTGEVLGVFETEEVRGFGDGLSAVQEGGGLLHHEVADDGGGCLTSGLADEVTKIVGREKQLLGAVSDGGQAEGALAAFIIIAVQKSIKTFQ